MTITNENIDYDVVVFVFVVSVVLGNFSVGVHRLIWRLILFLRRF